MNFNYFQMLLFMVYLASIYIDSQLFRLITVYSKVGKTRGSKSDLALYIFKQLFKIFLELKSSIYDMTKNMYSTSVFINFIYDSIQPIVGQESDVPHGPRVYYPLAFENKTKKANIPDVQLPSKLANFLLTQRWTYQRKN